MLVPRSLAADRGPDLSRIPTSAPCRFVTPESVCRLNQSALRAPGSLLANSPSHRPKRTPRLLKTPGAPAEREHLRPVRGGKGTTRRRSPRSGDRVLLPARRRAHDRGPHDSRRSVSVQAGGKSALLATRRTMRSVDQSGKVSVRSGSDRSSTLRTRSAVSAGSSIDTGLLDRVVGRSQSRGIGQLDGHPSRRSAR